MSSPATESADVKSSSTAGGSSSVYARGGGFAPRFAAVLFATLSGAASDGGGWLAVRELVALVAGYAAPRLLITLSATVRAETTPAAAVANAEDAESAAAAAGRRLDAVFVVRDAHTLVPVYRYTLPRPLAHDAPTAWGCPPPSATSWSLAVWPSCCWAVVASAPVYGSVRNPANAFDESRWHRVVHVLEYGTLPQSWAAAPGSSGCVRTVCTFVAAGPVDTPLRAPVPNTPAPAYLHTYVGDLSGHTGTNTREPLRHNRQHMRNLEAWVRGDVASASLFGQPIALVKRSPQTPYVTLCVAMANMVCAYDLTDAFITAAAAAAHSNSDVTTPSCVPAASESWCIPAIGTARGDLSAPVIQHMVRIPGVSGGHTDMRDRLVVYDGNTAEWTFRFSAHAPSADLLSSRARKYDEYAVLKQALELPSPYNLQTPGKAAILLPETVTAHKKRVAQLNDELRDNDDVTRMTCMEVLGWFSAPLHWSDGTSAPHFMREQTPGASSSLSEARKRRRTLLLGAGMERGSGLGLKLVDGSRSVDYEASSYSVDVHVLMRTTHVDWPGASRSSARYSSHTNDGIDRNLQGAISSARPSVACALPYRALFKRAYGRDASVQSGGDEWWSFPRRYAPVLLVACDADMARASVKGVHAWRTQNASDYPDVDATPNALWARDPNSGQSLSVWVPSNGSSTLSRSVADTLRDEKPLDTLRVRIHDPTHANAAEPRPRHRPRKQQQQSSHATATVAEKQSFYAAAAAGAVAAAATREREQQIEALRARARDLQKRVDIEMADATHAWDNARAKLRAFPMKQGLDDVTALRVPPTIIRIVLNAVLYWVHNGDEGMFSAPFQDARRALRRPDFITTLHELDVTRAKAALRRKVTDMMMSIVMPTPAAAAPAAGAASASGGMTITTATTASVTTDAGGAAAAAASVTLVPQQLRDAVPSMNDIVAHATRASRVCGVLAEWIGAALRYSASYECVEPVRAELDHTNATLAAALTAAASAGAATTASSSSAAALSPGRSASAGSASSSAAAAAAADAKSSAPAVATPDTLQARATSLRARIDRNMQGVTRALHRARDGVLLLIDHQTQRLMELQALRMPPPHMRAVLGALLCVVHNTDDVSGGLYNRRFLTEPAFRARVLELDPKLTTKAVQRKAYEALLSIDVPTPPAPRAAAGAVTITTAITAANSAADATTCPPPTSMRDVLAHLHHMHAPCALLAEWICSVLEYSSMHEAITAILGAQLNDVNTQLTAAAKVDAQPSVAAVMTPEDTLRARAAALQARIDTEQGDVAHALSTARVRVLALAAGAFGDVRAMLAPPLPIRNVLMCVCYLLGAPEDTMGTTPARRLLSNPNFRQRIAQLDVAHMTPAVRRKVMDLLLAIDVPQPAAPAAAAAAAAGSGGMTITTATTTTTITGAAATAVAATATTTTAPTAEGPSRLQRIVQHVSAASHACGVLCDWIRTALAYHAVVSVEIAPLRAELDAVNAQLAAAAPSKGAVAPTAAMMPVPTVSAGAAAAAAAGAGAGRSPVPPPTTTASPAEVACARAALPYPVGVKATVWPDKWRTTPRIDVDTITAAAAAASAGTTAGAGDVAATAPAWEKKAVDDAALMAAALRRNELIKPCARCEAHGRVQLKHALDAAGSLTHRAHERAQRAASRAHGDKAHNGLPCPHPVRFQRLMRIHTADPDDLTQAERGFPDDEDDECWVLGQEWVSGGLHPGGGRDTSQPAALACPRLFVMRVRDKRGTEAASASASSLVALAVEAKERPPTAVTAAGAAGAAVSQPKPLPSSVYAGGDDGDGDSVSPITKHIDRIEHDKDAREVRVLHLEVVARTGYGAAVVSEGDEFDSSALADFAFAIVS